MDGALGVIPRIFLFLRAKWCILRIFFSNFSQKKEYKGVAEEKKLGKKEPNEKKIKKE